MVKRLDEVNEKIEKLHRNREKVKNGRALILMTYSYSQLLLAVAGSSKHR